MERQTELNRKLAEWAGIRYEPDQDVFKVIFPNGSWYNIGHDWKLDEIEPDFPNSLDACFKWLVPKLTGKYYLNLIVDDLGGDARIYNRFKSTSGDLVALWQDKTPALALCLAIEKLIEKELNL